MRIEDEKGNPLPLVRFHMVREQVAEFYENFTDVLGEAAEEFGRQAPREPESGYEITFEVEEDGSMGAHYPKL